MKDLLQIIDNEPRVSHRLVAQNTGNQVKAISQIINKYKDEFTEFGGHPPFKMEAVSEKNLKANPDAKAVKTYYLNEPQATFLMTLLRNKPIVVEFKKKLVKAFFIMKDKLTTPDATLTQIAPVLQNLAEMMKLILENQDKQQIAPASLSLTPEQLGKIRGAVTLAAEVVAEFFEDELANAQKTIYSKLNNRMGVASYIYIPATAFSESMEILNDLERKYLQKLETRRAMQVEINSDDLPKF